MHIYSQVTLQFDYLRPGILTGFKCAVVGTHVLSYWTHCNRERTISTDLSSMSAFLKLWSADNKWSSSSALVVLLDWTVIQKRQKNYI